MEEKKKEKPILNPFVVDKNLPMVSVTTKRSNRIDQYEEESITVTGKTSEEALDTYRKLKNQEGKK